MSDVLVDTSVWLDFFRKSGSVYAGTLDWLLEENRVCTTRLIKAEIIPGAKTPKEFYELKDYFSALPLVEEPNSLWDEMMETQFRLQRKGIHAMGIPDLMIAIVAKAWEKTIFTKDHDFKLIKEVLPIRLLELHA